MVEAKHYYDFTNELSADEIYEGLLAYGLFTEKLPPMFTAKGFFNYCESQSLSFPKTPAEYIYHESMRNITPPVLWVFRILWHISVCANTYPRYGHSFNSILRKKPKDRIT